ncbi:MAG: HPr kinase/phosphatase C-terminal domain-containing protein [Bdellovibrionales bacterium]|jgi:serine kinase of HPr protein (carbohydrate metabolism regulator)
MFLHASCVAVNDRAVLLMGAAGVGKSDVALRLMEGGAALVADDQTVLTLEGDYVLASPPPTLAGMLEIRHVGLMQEVPYSQHVPVGLVVRLWPLGHDIERLPSKSFCSLLDQPIRELNLIGCEASTPTKIRLALQGRFCDVD